MRTHFSTHSRGVGASATQNHQCFQLVDIGGKKGFKSLHRHHIPPLSQESGGFFVYQSIDCFPREKELHQEAARTDFREVSLTTHSALKKVARTIHEHQLLREGDAVIVAVSGGADSVALLDFLVSLKDLQLNLIVAHLNHRLRGTESDDDAVFVTDLALHYGLRIEIGAADVREISRNRRLSLEEAGRVARYEWFRELADRYHARRVALGHHADDQAETFLLRLLRGAGTTGLRGMRPLSAGKHIRPLLYLTRSEILLYLKDRGLSFRVDGSNDDRSFLRNRIRHECLPYLTSYNPAITERLNAAAEILAADEDVLESLTDQVFGKISSCVADIVTLHLPELRLELPGMRLRLYRRAIRNSKGDLDGITGSHLKQVDELASSARVNGGVELPCRLTVVRCYDLLTFSSHGADKNTDSWEITIKGVGSHALPDGRIISTHLSVPPNNWKEVPPCRAYFDPIANPFPWTMRTFRHGDRFQPFGMTGTKKVKDFFIDEKIPAAVRRRVPLLFSGEKLLWICGLRVAETGRVSPDTREAILVEIPAITP
jgi:tRNA(Ile)-lysidine synthase